MNNTPHYLAAQDRLERVTEFAKSELEHARSTAGSPYRVAPEHATNAISDSLVAAMLSELLVILEPAEERHWRSQQREYLRAATDRMRTLRADLAALERDAQRGKRALRGLPY